jgi:hypothetical protein
MIGKQLSKALKVVFELTKSIVSGISGSDECLRSTYFIDLAHGYFR